MVLILLIVFTIAALIAAVVPYLHHINKEKISFANLFEENFDYAKAVRRKEILDLFFKWSIVTAACCIGLLFLYTSGVVNGKLFSFL